MQSLTRVLFGEAPSGKLPIDIPTANDPNAVLYPYGYDLSYGGRGGESGTGEILLAPGLGETDRIVLIREVRGAGDAMIPPSESPTCC